MPQEHSNNTGQTSSNAASATTLQRPVMTVASRNLPVITGRAAREGARERAKTNGRDEKMALWATQQSQRGGTTSCASRPCAGISRAKCLISLKATSEQVRFF